MRVGGSFHDTPRAGQAPAVAVPDTERGHRAWYYSGSTATTQGLSIPNTHQGFPALVLVR